jgi:5'-nucleotidase
MRFNSLFCCAGLYVASSQALNILLNNDDGFGSGNLRELYRLLKGEGHDGRLASA